MDQFGNDELTNHKNNRTLPSLIQFLLFILSLNQVFLRFGFMLSVNEAIINHYKNEILIKKIMKELMNACFRNESEGLENHG